LALTRQNLPTLQASAAYYQVCKGAYIVSSEQGAQPQAILMASGSEVHIALEAQQVLRARGVDARVLSMPCIELFRKQPVEYIEKLLPKHVTKRVAIEAASPFGWHEWVGEHGTVVGMKRFGASAPFEVLYEEFGITAEAVVKLLAWHLDLFNQHPRMATIKPKVYLLDAMALVYRAHFAMINSRLKNADGLSTGPIFGFANTITKMLDADQPTHIAVVWDTYAPTFRHTLDPNYKAHRPPQPEEITAAIPYIKKMIQAYGIVNLESDGYEADDIIGTLAKQAEISEADVFLVTPDKDYMQLVDDHICMLKPLNNGDGFEIVNREGVKAYFGVEPEWVIDVLALLGDSSYNVPWVPGIGKKWAPTLVLDYVDLVDMFINSYFIDPQRIMD
jgi:hypothetical protein